MNSKGCDFLFSKMSVSAPGTSALVGLSWFIYPFLVSFSLCDVWGLWVLDLPVIAVITWSSGESAQDLCWGTLEKP